MSPSVNRSSDSPLSSGENQPEVSSVQNQHPTTPIGDIPNANEPAESTDSTDSTDLTDLTDSPDSPDSPDSTDLTENPSSGTIQRQQPIPPPSEPMQYRAIGLIRGQYMPSADQLTRGTLLAADGTLIDSVLLGRVMSLVKNHLDLSQSHLWVVYPRTRQENGNLHVQIVGVWEPEKLNRVTSTETPDSEKAPEVEQFSDSSEPDDLRLLSDGYFSIRGQVIYQSRDGEQVIVKIKQSPRRETEKTKFFKVKLKGLLGDRVINHFWDLHVQRQENTLLILEGNDIGMVPVKRSPFNKHKGRGRRPEGGRPDGRKNVSNQRPVRKPERPASAGSGSAPPKRRDPLPKPVKRSEPRGGGGSGSST